MRSLLLIILLGMGFKMAALTPSDSISVYLFLREDCVICQQYAPQLQALYTEYGGKGIHFLGLFPNASSSQEGMEEFAEKFGVSFPLKIDSEQSVTQTMGATITPEVIIYDHRLRQVLYSGRIDDRYARVGKRRRHVQASELEDALKAIRTRQPVAVRQTTAIGCLITPLE